MPDNIFFGPQAGANHSLALLRAASFTRAITAETAIAPGITLSSDPEANVRGTVHSAPGAMLTLTMDPEDRPRWVSLVLDMGVIDLNAQQWLGVICAVQAERAVTVRLMLRTTIDGGYVDSPYRKTVAAYAEQTTHIDALDLTREPSVPRAGAKRELIFMFEPVAQRLQILNLGVFVV